MDTSKWLHSSAGCFVLTCPLRIADRNGFLRIYLSTQAHGEGAEGGGIPLGGKFSQRMWGGGVTWVEKVLAHMLTQCPNISDGG